jgi:hypothetical protein
MLATAGEAATRRKSISRIIPASIEEENIGRRRQSFASALGR